MPFASRNSRTKCTWHCDLFHNHGIDFIAWEKKRVFGNDRVHELHGVDMRDWFISQVAAARQR